MELELKLRKLYNVNCFVISRFLLKPKFAMALEGHKPLQLGKTYRVIILEVENKNG